VNATFSRHYCSFEQNAEAQLLNKTNVTVGGGVKAQIGNACCHMSVDDACMLIPLVRTKASVITCAKGLCYVSQDRVSWLISLLQSLLLACSLKPSRVSCSHFKQSSFHVYCPIWRQGFCFTTNNAKKVHQSYKPTILLGTRLSVAAQCLHEIILHKDPPAWRRTWKFSQIFFYSK